MRKSFPTAPGAPSAAATSRDRPRSSASAAPAIASDLLLKVTPPRVSQQLITRKRLAFFGEQLRGQPLVLLCAPGGFGKTSLLAQWRLEHLAQGFVVAWLSAQPQDDPVRLVQALALSLRHAGGCPELASALFDTPPSDGLDAAIRLLAEIAQEAMETTLLIDRADHLSTGSAMLLAYLMRNAPANLRVVVATRPESRLAIDDLIDYGQCRVIGPAQLRFQLDETQALVANRFATRLDNDTAARLHDTAEGWPLGLQLALAAVAGADDPQTELAALSHRGGDRQWLGLLLDNLKPGDAEFLISVSIADILWPELCRAITECNDAPEQLARLAHDTPLLASDEQDGGLRMHQMVRGVLRQRFAEQPAKQQALLHERALHWLANHGCLEAAARHAFSAGQRGWAYHLAERCLYKDLMTHGRQGVVLEWLGRLPAVEVDRRPQLLLAAAWALATSGRQAQSARLASRITALPDISDALRCECDLALSTAAYFSDDPDRFVALIRHWGESPPLRDPILLMAYRQHAFFCDALAGEPALARLKQQQLLNGDSNPRSYSARWGQFAVGLTYLREGQVLLAERQMRQTLASAEADLGRRNPFTCMAAALRAGALWEMGRAEEAALLLANRLDVLERFGNPETVILGYRVLARTELLDGSEHRALALLDAMGAVGVARELPRVVIASLVERMKIHARRFRAESCRTLAEQLERLLAAPDLQRGPIWWRDAQIQRHLARVYGAIAQRDWQQALALFDQAPPLARQAQDCRLRIEFLCLRALALEHCGDSATHLLREAADLAHAFGLQRIFIDVHPMLTEQLKRIAPDMMERARPEIPPRELDAAPLPRAQVTPSVALTPKEREVLELLAHNLTNKEIGLAMQVSDQAIKWHLKNLFAKLGACTRKQLLQKARIQGIILPPS